MNNDILKFKIIVEVYLDDNMTNFEGECVDIEIKTMNDIKARYKFPLLDDIDVEQLDKIAEKTATMPWDKEQYDKALTILEKQKWILSFILHNEIYDKSQFSEDYVNLWVHSEITEFIDENHMISLQKSVESDLKKHLNQYKQLFVVKQINSKSK